MAIETFTRVIDDLDGTVITEGESLSFRFDNADYEIDLSAENAAAFRAALEPYLNAARARKPGASRSVPQRRRVRNPEAERIREWAEQNGIAYNARGKLAQSVRDAYEEAQARARSAA